MSEKTLDKLIAKLKSEAVEAAEKEANDIIENAKTKAQSILNDAQVKSDELLKNADNESEANSIKAKGALKQAARDLTVSLRNDLLNLLGNVLEKEVKKTFTADLIETAVLKVIENVGSGVALKLPENIESNLADQIQKRLQASENLTSITTNNSLVNSFSISKTEEGWSYDISPEEVANLLKTHLSQKWLDILKTDS
jgi:cell division septum initiation protein DivIVA